MQTMIKEMAEPTRLGPIYFVFQFKNFFMSIGLTIGGELEVEIEKNILVISRVPALSFEEPSGP